MNKKGCHSELYQKTENIYGHQKRLRWITNHLHHNDSILEIGCGTGYMITLPLCNAGYHIVGLDVDAQSIHYGQHLARKCGLSKDNLIDQSLALYKKKTDVVILSEVMEHLTDNELIELLRDIKSALNENGRLLVTVPNGYGWYEFESWLWKQMGVGWFFRHVLLFERVILKFKTTLTGKCKEELIEQHPSTFDESPHVQRFRLKKLCDFMETQGFHVRDFTGSVLIAGQLSNLFFTGFSSITKLNNKVGDTIPSFAAGFYVAFEKQ